MHHTVRGQKERKSPCFMLASNVAE